MIVSCVCDMCGKELLVDEDVRYIANIEVYAAYDPLELTADDLAKDHKAELTRLVEKLKGVDAKDAEDSVHKRIVLNLCPGCQKVYIRDPLFRELRGA